MQELVGLYTTAAEYYDKVDERDQAELYRQKILMIFIKPKVMQIYQVQ